MFRIGAGAFQIT